MLRRIPIATQIMVLTALATLLASAAMVAITFGGPPPMAAPRPVSDIAAMLEHREPLSRGAIPIEETVVGQAPAASEGLQRDTALERQLEHILGTRAGDIRAFTEWSRPPGSEPRNDVIGSFRIARREAGETWRVLEAGADESRTSWAITTGLTMAAVLLAILFAAWWLARIITVPIRRLEAAASKTRTGDLLDADLPEGPPEIHKAAAALEDLYRRNRDHAEQRLTMLGAIAHDLGTPLMRLAFRVEQLPDDERAAAQGDIETMRQMLANSLTMARGDAGELHPVELHAIVRDIATREESLGRPVTLGPCDTAVIEGHTLSLGRMVQNLIDNALRYGGDAQLSLRKEAGQAVLRVADGGEGFPQAGRRDLLRPYVRGEGSRNSATGGSGLGLAIVAQVVERHGGTIQLEDAPGGGGLVIVSLPLV